MKALVTGGAGYIGSHTVRALLDAGHDVAVVDDLSNGHRDAIDTRAKYVEGKEVNDLLSGDHVLEAILRIEKPDVVLHFAGKIQVGESVRYPSAYWNVNVVGSLSLLRAILARHKCAFVFSSSAAVYGAPPLERGRFPKLTEDHPTLPINPYGDTKLAFERALAAYARAAELPWAALRYFNAAGANVAAGLSERHKPETHLIPLVLDVARGKCEAFTIYGTDFPTPDGTCVRDYVHVMDLADAHVLAAEKLVRTRTPLGPLNLGTGFGHSVREVIDAAREIAQYPIPTIYGPRREGDPPVLLADPSRAERELDWRATRSSIEQILSDAWHASSRR